MHNLWWIEKERERQTERERQRQRERERDRETEREIENNTRKGGQSKIYSKGLLGPRF
jgi:hypothetical protein